nr:hypothetical protein [Tanacetum cinerariifolium]GEW42314.1 hypothetical protein [Tanacetum cinerariifolium]
MYLSKHKFRCEIMRPTRIRHYIDPITGYRMNRTNRRKEGLTKMEIFLGSKSTTHQMKKKNSQNIIPNIVTQVTKDLNNGNGGNGNGGGNNGCTYKGFVVCGPRDFDGTGGVVALTRWVEKMESVIDNNRCLANQRVKYAASSFIGKALTWWNTQVQARGRDAANVMAWDDFKALLTTEFYPSNKIEKLESEFWNHSMVGADQAGYTDRFQELEKLVPHLVTPKAKRVTRYINGLPSQIRGILRATQPATIQAAILTAGILTDEAVRSGTLTKVGEKRKERDKAIPLRRERGNFPRCAKSKGFHAENGPCKVCYNCQRQGHMAKDCRNRGRGQLGNQLALEWNKNTRGYGNRARGRAFNVNVVDALQDPNVVMELEDSIFTIDLIPLGHGSFDVIVGMDWLSNHKAVIVCYEKIVRIPMEGGKVLCVQGERSVGKTKTLMSTKENEPKLSNIPIVRDFKDVFPDDLSGLPPQRQVEFCIDLIPGATLIARYKGLKTKQKWRLYIPFATPAADVAATWTCGTQSADVALPRRLTRDLHADVAADMAATWQPLTHPLTGGQHR